jgi:dolichyl-phosphate-mannose--protein O-mannosyl transferase
MYYYRGREFMPEGFVATIMCMGNPAVWWAGVAAVFYTLGRWAKPYALGQWGEKRDPRPAMLLLAVAAQYVPWMLVPRSMFIYHYFGSLPFIILCIVYAFSRIEKARPDVAKWLGIGFVAVAALLFVGFYPIATGVPVPLGWADAMNWFSFLKLPDWQYRGWLYY